MTIYQHIATAMKSLKDSLAGKANTSHTHTIANVTNLQTTLDSKLSSVPNATETVVGGVKARVDATTGALYLTNDGTNP